MTSARATIHRVALAFLVILSLLLPRGAVAATGDERPRVLLIGKGPDDPLLKALRAELSDLDVTVVQRDAADRLDAAAREEGAAAAIRLLSSHNGVEVWMADASSGRSLLRQLIVDESPGGPNHSVVALQTVELLRTSLLFENAEPPAPPSPPPEPVKPTESKSPRSEPAPRGHRGEAGAQAGLGALYSPGGAGAAFQLWLAAHYPVNDWLSLGVDLSLPLGRGSIAGPEGTALVGAQLAAVDARLRFRLGGPWFAGLGAAVGVLRLTTEGKAVPPLEATEDDVVTGVLLLRADGGLAVAPWLRVGARAAVGASLPRVELSFAGNRAGTWGLPVLGALGFVEIPWG